MDFVGYTTGKPTTPDPALTGFVGLLDFAGYSVGNNAEVIASPATVRHGGYRQRNEPKKKRMDDDEIILML